VKKQLLSGIVFSILINLVVKTVWIFAIDLNVQRAVGTEAYGEYFSSFGFALLFVMLLDLGISSFNTKNIAQNHHLLQKHFSNLALLKTGLGFLYFFILLIGGFFMQYSFAQMSLLLALGLVQFFTSFVLFLRSNISALQLFKLDAILSVIDRFLLIVVCSVWLWSGWFTSSITIFTFAWLQVFTSVLTCFIGLAFLLPYVRLQKTTKNKAFYYSIIQKSYPYAVLTFLMTIYVRADGIILAKLSPNAFVEAGTFAAAFRLFEAFSQIAILFSAILFPFFAKSIKEKQEIASAFSSSLTILLWGAIMCSAGCFFYAEKIASLFYREHVPETATIIRWFIWSTIPYGISLVSGAYLTAHNQIKYLNKIALLCLVINGSLNLIFAPRYGAIASAFIAFLTHGCSAFFLTIKTAYESKNQLGKLFPVKIILYTLLSIALGFLLMNFIPLQAYLLILIALGLACKMLPFGAFYRLIAEKLKK